MNSKEYIESGILEAYVLGSLSDAEKREVEKYASEFPEIKKELLLIESSLENFALLSSKTPPASLKEKISSAIFETKATETKVISLNRFSELKKFPQWAVAATITLLIATSFSAIVFYVMLSDSNKRFAEVYEQKNFFNDSIKKQDSIIKSTSSQLALLKNPKNKMIMLKGMEKAPDAKVMVVWNKDSKEVFLSIQAIPVPQPGMQYQFWAIVNGKPVDAGMISLTDTAFHKMKDFEKADAFAITLEKEGGSSSPTMSEMYAMGKP